MALRKPPTPFSRRRLSKRAWLVVSIWPLVCLCFAALLWQTTLDRIRAERLLLEKNAADNAVMLARGYAAYVEQRVQQIDQTLLELAFYSQRSNGTLRLDEPGAAKVYSPGVFQSIAIVDANGKMVTATSHLQDARGQTLQAVDVADRAYFNAHRLDRSEALRIDTADAGKITGAPVIQFTRRLNLADGSFGGVVVLCVQPNFFTSYWTMTAIGPEGMLALFANDGVLLAARSGREAEARTSPFASTVLPSDLPRAGTLVDGGRFHDQTARFVATQPVSGHPLVATAGVGRDRYFMQATRSWDFSRQTLYASSAVLAIFALVATILTARFAFRREGERTEREAYRLATESSQDCFYLLRAIYNARRDIVDFKVIDCNEAGPRLFGRTRDTFIGVTVSSMYSGDYLKRMMDVYQRAMDNGQYEDEYRVPKQSPLVNSQWLHRKFVRAGSNLAMTVRDISESKAYQSSLLRMAKEDALTQLPNRHGLDDYLPKAISMAASRHATLALFFIDLDGFKAINDIHGHLCGDEALKEIARRIRESLREGDTAVRLGGDEFLIVLEQVANREILAQVASRLCSLLTEPILLNEVSVVVGASIGISLYPEDGENVDTLLKNADDAMYAVKYAGKGSFAFYSSEGSVVRKRGT